MATETMVDDIDPALEVVVSESTEIKTTVTSTYFCNSHVSLNKIGSASSIHYQSLRVG